MVKKLLFLFFLFLCCFPIRSQDFDRVQTIDLKGGYLGFASFVDYDSDGLSDVFVTGLDFGSTGDFRHAMFYKNNGDRTFTESTIASIPRTIYGDCSWGDFDNNGTPDLIYTGTTSGYKEDYITKIYKNINNGCEFVEISHDIPRLSNCSVDWVDVNNDGLLDIHYQGINSTNSFDLGIFKNNGDGSFSKVEDTGFTSINGGLGNLTANNAEWADFDSDGLKDVLMASSTNSERQFALYKNLGNFKFEKINFALPQFSYVKMDVGDINNDGRPDFVFTGSTKLYLDSADYGVKIYIYINNGNMNFTNSFSIDNDGVLLSQIKLGDFDNDGFCDLFNYGSGNSFKLPKIYMNNKDGTFSEKSHTFPVCSSGGIDFGDYDNDDDLDILYYGRTETPRDDEMTQVYENKIVNMELPSEILFTNACGCSFEGSFSLNNTVDAVQWDFSDATTGVLNASSSPRPSHVFSKKELYTVSARYTKGSVTNTLLKTIAIIGPPVVAEPTAIFTCTANEQFNFSDLKDAEILNGLPAADYEISYHLSRNEAANTSHMLPQLYAIQNADQNIFVRIQSKEKPSCYVIKDFSIRVLPSPIAHATDPIYVCDAAANGFAAFDLSAVENTIIRNQTNVRVEYFDSNGQVLQSPLPSAYTNIVAKEDYITAKVMHAINACISETIIHLIVSPLPIAHPLPILIGCDDTNDGISEYFDTSGVEKAVVGNQTGMIVTYYDSFGSQFTNLPNPFTNSIQNTQNIVVRVTDSNTNCFSETILTLQTSSKPAITRPQNVYACDEGNGFADFTTASIESQLVGNQSGLRISYKDIAGNSLPSPLPLTFRNTIATTQTIFVTVENRLNPLCFSETSFDLVVNKVPLIDLEKNYSICELEPSLTIALNPGFESYEWKFQDGAIVSVAAEAKIGQEGNYTVKVSKMEHGLSCENFFSFHLKRSLRPSVQTVNYDEFGNNFIKIITAENGNFEYSIDGLNFQDSNLFDPVSGGTYTVYVRDKDGCGVNSAVVTVLDYPKFFTPNNDGVNDFWQLKAIQEYPNAQIFIFDRFGKILKKLSSNDIGWNGSYNGAPLAADDYWFSVQTDDKNKIVKGHFTLKR